MSEEKKPKKQWHFTLKINEEGLYETDYSRPFATALQAMLAEIEDERTLTNFKQNKDHRMISFGNPKPWNQQ